jgi:hypothetical protein
MISLYFPFPVAIEKAGHNGLSGKLLMLQDVTFEVFCKGAFAATWLSFN